MTNPKWQERVQLYGFHPNSECVDGSFDCFPLSEPDVPGFIYLVKLSDVQELQEKYDILETKFKIYEGLAVKPNRMILEFDKE